MPIFSRRDFLQLSALASLGLAFDWAQPAPDPFYTLGRVTTNYLRVRASPSDSAKQVGWFGLDEVIKVYDTINKEGQAWHALANGFVETNEVQPVENRLNPAVTDVTVSGFVGEITVPFTEAYRRPALSASSMFRLYYSSTYWVRGFLQDSAGMAWYKLYDDRLGINYYTPAAYVRAVPDSETAPLASLTANKRIVVNLHQQRLHAYEGATEVFSTLISAGRLYLAADGSIQSWTPPGQYKVERKKPSRHMGFGEAAGSDYELPGVPWVSYFHWKGFSFHGTWWHNDFGRPRSAGCINMRPLEALWVFRWSLPTALPGQELTTGVGTAVEVIED